jgi:hypothetical protein
LGLHRQKLLKKLWTKTEYPNYELILLFSFFLSPLQSLVNYSKAGTREIWLVVVVRAKSRGHYCFQLPVVESVVVVQQKTSRRRQVKWKNTEGIEDSESYGQPFFLQTISVCGCASCKVLYLERGI